MAAVAGRPTVTLPRLRQLRVAAFLSQTELARRAGVSAQTIIRLERGDPAELVTARKLAAALGVEPSVLARPPETE